MMYCRQHQASQPLTLAEQAAEKDRQHAKKRSLFEQNEHDERGAIGRLFMSDEGMLNIQAQAAILARRVSYFDVGAREVRQLALIPNQQ